MNSSTCPTRPRRGDPRERGAVLVVAMIALVALLGIGVVTMLSVRSDTAAAGADRFQQVALYAAESGVAAGIDFIRQSCDSTNMFSNLVEPDNVNPQAPTGIVGNGAQPGATGNLFTASPQAWYQVYVLNNEDDTGLPAGDDLDGKVVLRAIGHGPNRTQVTLDVEIQSPECIASFCGGFDYAQAFVNAQNDAIAKVCSSGNIDLSGGLRTAQIGN